MNVNRTILLLFFGITLITFRTVAQEEVAVTTAYFFGSCDHDYYQNPFDTAYVFADVCNVRKEPRKDAEIVARLPIGTFLQIESMSPEKLTINGVESNWLKIKSDTTFGYVWGGALTNELLPLSDGKYAVWGIVKIEEKRDLYSVYASVRIAKNHQVASSADFKVLYGGNPLFGELAVFERPIMDSVTHMLVYRSIADACGIAASDHYLIETNGQLKYVGSGYVTGESTYLSSREMIFPFSEEDMNVGGHYFTPRRNIVLLIENEGELNENCVWENKTTVEEFEWKNSELFKHCDE